MNNVQYLLDQLRDVVLRMPSDKLNYTHYRTTMLKIDELDAWLCWTDVKAYSGQVPETENKTAASRHLTDDQWFKLLEKHRRNYLVIMRDRNNNFYAEVREEGAPVIYYAPDLRQKDPDYIHAFLEAMEI